MRATTFCTIKLLQKIFKIKANSPRCLAPSPKVCLPSAKVRRHFHYILPLRKMLLAFCDERVICDMRLNLRLVRTTCLTRFFYAAFHVILAQLLGAQDALKWL